MLYSHVAKSINRDKQELRSWVGKIRVGIGLHFIQVGNTLFHSIMYSCLYSIVPVELTLSDKFGTQRKTHTHTHIHTHTHTQTVMFIELLRNLKMFLCELEYLSK